MLLQQKSDQVGFAEDTPPGLKVTRSFIHGTTPYGIGVPVKWVESVEANDAHTAHQLNMLLQQKSDQVGKQPCEQQVNNNNKAKTK